METEKLEEIAREHALDLLNACKGKEEYQENENEGLSGLDKYFEEKVLDYRIVRDKDGCYQGCQLLVAYGGPTVWANTEFDEIRVFWGGREGNCATLSNSAEILDLYMKNILEE